MERKPRRIGRIATTSVVIQLVVFFLALGVCSAKDTDVIKIGINCSLTGRGALWGQAMVRGGGIIVDQIRAQGGIAVGGKKYFVELIPYDHALDPTKGLENTKRMVFTDKVDFAEMQNLTGSYPGFPILTQNKILSTDQCAGVKSIDPKFPYNFRVIPDADGCLTTLFRFSAEQMGAKNFVAVNPDDESGWGTLAPTQRSAERTGLKMLGAEFYTRGTTDFYPLLTKVLAKKPDLVDFGSSDPGSIPILVKQIRELGYKGLLSAMWNFLTEESLKIMGKEAVEGVITLQGANPPHLAPEFLTPEQKAFMEANLKKNKPPFEVTDFMGATNTVVLIEGIMKAKSLNSDKVKKALETSEITVFGKKTRFGGARIYGQGHQLLQEYPVYVVKDGKATFQKWVPPLVD